MLKWLVTRPLDGEAGSKSLEPSHQHGINNNYYMQHHHPSATTNSNSNNSLQHHHPSELNVSYTHGSFDGSQSAVEQRYGVNGSSIQSKIGSFQARINNFHGDRNSEENKQVYRTKGKVQDLQRKDKALYSSKNNFIHVNQVTVEPEIFSSGNISTDIEYFRDDRNPVEIEVRKSLLQHLNFLTWSKNDEPLNSSVIVNQQSVVPNMSNLPYQHNGQYGLSNGLSVGGKHPPMMVPTTEVSGLSKGAKFKGAYVTDDPLATLSSRRNKGTVEEIYAVSR